MPAMHHSSSPLLNLRQRGRHRALWQLGTHRCECALVVSRRRCRGSDRSSGGRLRRGAGTAAVAGLTGAAAHRSEPPRPWPSRGNRHAARRHRGDRADLVDFGARIRAHGDRGHVAARHVHCRRSWASRDAHPLGERTGRSPPSRGQPASSRGRTVAGQRTARDRFDDLDVRARIVAAAVRHPAAAHAAGVGRRALPRVPTFREQRPVVSPHRRGAGESHRGSGASPLYRRRDGDQEP